MEYLNFLNFKKSTNNNNRIIYIRLLDLYSVPFRDFYVNKFLVFTVTSNYVF